MRIDLFRLRDVLVVRDEELVIPKELVWKKINKRNGTDSTGGSAFGAAAAPPPPSPVDDPLPPPVPATSTSAAAAASSTPSTPSSQVSTTSTPATDLPSAAAIPPTSSSVTNEGAPSLITASTSSSPTDTLATTQLVPHTPSPTDASQTLPPQPTVTMTATPSTSLKTFATSFSAAADSLPSFTSVGVPPSSETNGAHGGGSIDVNPSTASGIVQGSAGNTTAAASKATVAVSVVLIMVGSIALFTGVVFLIRRIYRRRRLGKAEYPFPDPSHTPSPFAETASLSAIDSQLPLSIERSISQRSKTSPFAPLGIEGRDFVSGVGESNRGRFGYDEKWQGARAGGERLDGQGGQSIGQGQRTPTANQFMTPLVMNGNGGWNDGRNSMADLLVQPGSAYPRDRKGSRGSLGMPRGF